MLQFFSNYLGLIVLGLLSGIATPKGLGTYENSIYFGPEGVPIHVTQTPDQ